MASDKLLSEFLDFQVDTERMKDAARGDDRPIAVLQLQIPIGEGRAAGWFGGKPKLPADVDWPAIDGRPLPFVCQIDLAAVPAGVWGGVGPRKGWLAVFLTDEGAFQVRVLHVDGAVAERQGPGPQSAGWARHVQWKSPRIFHLPQWPVTIEERGGTTLHQPVDSDTVPVDRERRATIQLKLNDPAFLPFNKDTLAYLREKIGAELVKQARTACNLSMTERLRPADRRWFEQQKTIAMQSLQRFFEIEESLQTTSPFDIDRLVEAMTDLIDLPTYEYVYDRDDADGFRELRYRQSKLCDPLSFGRISTPDWWTRFQVELGWHAVVAYTRDPTALHSPARTRFEDEWRAESRGCFAGMGHAPVGHIYTPHGPGTPNEVLLELPTSNLVGWIWGDCYSLVLTIDREDLRRDDFSKMSLDITN